MWVAQAQGLSGSWPSARLHVPLHRLPFLFSWEQSAPQRGTTSFFLPERFLVVSIILAIISLPSCHIEIFWFWGKGIGCVFSICILLVTLKFYLLFGYEKIHAQGASKNQ